MNQIEISKAKLEWHKTWLSITMAMFLAFAVATYALDDKWSFLFELSAILSAGGFVIVMISYHANHEKLIRVLRK